MRALYIALLLFANIHWTSACASEYSIAPIRIDIPSGFEGPNQQSQGQATVVAFLKPHSDSAVKTLLQISFLDFGTQLQNVPKSDLDSSAAKYLLELAGGVERRRVDFKRSEPSSVMLGGLPGAKLTWTGRIDGMDAVGVMYCVVVGTRIISFHTQDVAAAPTPAMNDAVQAIESVKIDGGA
ncbi:hypothetical protein [Tahibacter sp.]|uniref:hypothetical protein n=1 Tax=Tahibacter sp. TaxID=2056211 RepID=UPI0028C3DF73|nr:hypothetical protein [Tahibacter sp.]